MRRWWQAGGWMAVGALLAGEGARAWPIREGDWELDTAPGYGGRSRIEEGSMYFWTESPLAGPEVDADDQRFYYYGGYVPAGGPYSIEARVVLPVADGLAPYDPDGEVVSLYELGVVASGLLFPTGSEEDLPALHAGVVYQDVSVDGTAYSAGDRFVSVETGDDVLPIRIGGTEIATVRLRAAFDGIDRLRFAYSLAESGGWIEVAECAVQVRGGMSARAEIRGGAGNLLLDEEDAGSITDFRVRQSYEAWLDTEQVQSPDREKTADPDGDGLVNFLEYALALDPLAEDDDGWMELDAIPTVEGPCFSVAHRCSRTADVRVGYETSADLKSGWGPAERWALALAALDPDGWGKADWYRLAAPPASPCGFLRLVVVEGSGN